MKSTFKKITVFILVAAFGLFLSGCATKEYTITFNSDGGSNVNSQTIAKNDVISEPTAPTRDGYIFLGWYDENGDVYDFSTKVTKDVTLIAKWEEEGEKYTVTFNSDGGSTVSSQSITKDSKASKPSNPTKEGYTFKYWSYEDSEYDFSTAVTKDITLKAIWEKDTTTTPQGNNGGNTGGNNGGNTGGNNGGGTTTPTNVTVTFNLNGGTGTAPAAQTFAKGGKATQPQTDPQRDGYTFLGWRTVTSGGSNFNFATAINANTTLYAVWQQNSGPQYTITTTVIAPDQVGDRYALTIKKIENGVTTYLTQDVYNQNMVRIGVPVDGQIRAYKSEVDSATGYKIVINSVTIPVNK